MTAHLRIYKPAKAWQQGLPYSMDFLNVGLSASSEQSKFTGFLAFWCCPKCLASHAQDPGILQRPDHPRAKVLHMLRHQLGILRLVQSHGQ
jgi:hypothetical protein